MASRRALDLISRGQSFTSHFFRQAVSWLKFPKSEKPESNTYVIYVTPFERAMRDVYGPHWKQRLNPAQQEFLRKKIAARWRNRGQPVRPAREDEYDTAWHERVGYFRSQLLQHRARKELRPERSSPDPQA